LFSGPDAVARDTVDGFSAIESSASAIRVRAERYSGRPLKAVQPVNLPNGICREGWELVNGSVSQWKSRNSVCLVRFYLFRRCEANRQRPASIPHVPARQPVSAVAETAACGTTSPHP
jgi:hypothetical protein